VSDVIKDLEMLMLIKAWKCWCWSTATNIL